VSGLASRALPHYNVMGSFLLFKQEAK